MEERSMENRVIKAIADFTSETAQEIASGRETIESAEEFRRLCDLDVDDHTFFRECMVDGEESSDMLNPAEIASVLEILGPNPDHFNGHDVCTKTILRGIFKELLDRIIEPSRLDTKNRIN